MRSIAFVLVAATACSSHTPSKQITGDEARQVLIDRNWIDRMPETERDKLHVYRFVPSMGGGVYQDRTIFKGTFELFQFEATNEEIRFNLLETHDKVKSHYRIESVDGPAPFDLKLTIDADPRGPHTYYGIRAETDRDGHVLEQELRSTRASH
ncbi:MAG: hypothetical protein JO257_02715 [Deltaproteobacteria bacterium]|nr:hypothetical protein [Deltaproteobacteria bacterium]